MHTFKGTPYIDILVPHAITVCEDVALRTAQLDMEGVMYSQAARAAVERAGSCELTLADSRVPVNLFITEHSSTINLPKPEENVVRVVSKLTILAALRDNRPIDDLLFLYGDIRHEDGSFKGVKGFGQPQPQKRTAGMHSGRNQQRGSWQPAAPQADRQGYRYEGTRDSLSPTRLINTCPYPGKLYALQTPHFTAPDAKPIVHLPIPVPKNQTKVLYEEELNGELTEKLGVPVYKTWVRGVENDYAKQDDDVLRLANPNVLVALGAEAMSKGYVTLASEVRSKAAGTVIGGKALTMFGTSLLEGPLM